MYASVYDLIGTMTRFAVAPRFSSSSVCSSSAIVSVRFGRGVRMCFRLYGRCSSIFSSSHGRTSRRMVCEGLKLDRTERPSKRRT